MLKKFGYSREFHLLNAMNPFPLFYFDIFFACLISLFLQLDKGLGTRWCLKVFVSHNRRHLYWLSAECLCSCSFFLIFFYLCHFLILFPFLVLFLRVDWRVEALIKFPTQKLLTWKSLDTLLRPYSQLRLDTLKGKSSFLSSIKASKPIWLILSKEIMT